MECWYVTYNPDTFVSFRLNMTKQQRLLIEFISENDFAIKLLNRKAVNRYLGIPLLNEYE